MVRQTGLWYGGVGPDAEVCRGMVQTALSNVITDGTGLDPAPSDMAGENLGHY